MTDIREQKKLTLMINRRVNKVVYAQCTSAFLDTLVSFLTLPLSTIIHTIEHKSPSSCWNLYLSVKELDSICFGTKACKNMLLYPRSNSEVECEKLSVNLCKGNPRVIFRCPKQYCHRQLHRKYSSVAGTLCDCGTEMIQFSRTIDQTIDDGAFLKINDDLYILTDVLQFRKSSDQITGCTEICCDGLEPMEAVVSHQDIIMLLHRTIISSTPLSDVFLNSKSFRGTGFFAKLVRSILPTMLCPLDSIPETVFKDSEDDLLKREIEIPALDEGHSIEIRLGLNKINHDVVYMLYVTANLSI